MANVNCAAVPLKPTRQARAPRSAAADPGKKSADKSTPVSWMSTAIVIGNGAPVGEKDGVALHDSVGVDDCVSAALALGEVDEDGVPVRVLDSEALDAGTALLMKLSAISRI